MTSTEAIDYMKYGATACLALGAVLQYFCSWGLSARMAALIGGLMAVGVYLVIATATYHGDWRLLFFEGLAVVPGFAGSILGGMSGTNKVGQAIVNRGETPEDRAKIAAHLAVPVTPSTEAP